MHRIVIMLVVVLLAACQKQIEQPTSRAELLSPGLATPDETISARDLYTAYLTALNQGTDDAHHRYDGKILRVSGEVLANHVHGGKRELKLVATDRTGVAFCDFEDEQGDEVAFVAPGQSITLQCVCAGWTVGPHLIRCARVR